MCETGGGCCRDYGADDVGHCQTELAGPLAIHLVRHGRIPSGEEIEIRQGQEIGRPSLIYARAEGAADHIDRVEVGGSAVVVARLAAGAPAR